eukprot:3156354-Pleurochrysis_carterae.AAC.1
MVACASAPCAAREQSVGSETYKTIVAKLLSGIDVLVQMDWYQQERKAYASSPLPPHTHARIHARAHASIRIAKKVGAGRIEERRQEG